MCLALNWALGNIKIQNRNYYLLSGKGRKQVSSQTHMMTACIYTHFKENRGVVAVLDEVIRKILLKRFLN